MENIHFLDKNGLFPCNLAFFSSFTTFFSKTKREPIRKCNISREIREILRQNALFPEKEAPLCSSHWLVEFFSQAWGTRGKCYISREKSTLFFSKKNTHFLYKKRGLLRPIFFAKCFGQVWGTHRNCDISQEKRLCRMESASFSRNKAIFLKTTHFFDKK